MKLRSVLSVAGAVALAAACSAGQPAPSLAGNWSGTITCYSMESPLSMTIDAAKPAQAAMAIGDGGVFPWEASVTVDGSRAVTIKSTIQSGDAQLLTGTLDATGTTISGAIERQLCNKFTLVRQP